MSHNTSQNMNSAQALVDAIAAFDSELQGTTLDSNSYPDIKNVYNTLLEELNNVSEFIFASVESLLPALLTTTDDDDDGDDDGDDD